MGRGILTLGLLKLLGTTYVTGDCAIAQPDPSITVFGERRSLSLRSLGPQSLYKQDEGLERFSFWGLLLLRHVLLWPKLTVFFRIF